ELLVTQNLIYSIAGVVIGPFLSKVLGVIILHQVLNAVCLLKVRDRSPNLKREYYPLNYSFANQQKENEEPSRGGGELRSFAFTIPLKHFHQLIFPVVIYVFVLCYLFRCVDLFDH